jgi:hypothetical protein
MVVDIKVKVVAYINVRNHLTSAFSCYMEEANSSLELTLDLSYLMD